MAKILPLPHSVIHAIAAGEVVERPAVVVKELIENALDAGATEISVWLEQSGLQKIQVTDNGRGIDRDELLIATQHHTTSKISAVSDLEKIVTFGFRGEALASIAQVSQFTLQSKTHDAPSGYQLQLEYGENEAGDKNIQPIAHPVGTTIKVENLFSNVPARRKFIRHLSTELRRCTEVMIALALAHPEVSFSAFHHQKQLIALPKHQTLAERVSQVFGTDLATGLLPLQFDSPTLKLSGLIGTPQIARRNSAKQFIFVNSRFVSSTKIAQAVKESYGSLLDHHFEPMFILFIALSPALIDVNVHPRKESVSFMDEPQILELLQRTIEAHLNQADVSYQYSPHLPALSQLGDSAVLSAQPFPADKTASRWTQHSVRSIVQAWQLQTQTTEPEILQIHNTYLITQTEQGLVMIDQHAAHERILYHQFSQAFTEATQRHVSIALPQPALIELSLTDTQLLLEHLSALQKIGFSIEQFQPKTFSITHVPILLKDRPITQLLRELLDEMSAGKPVPEVDTTAKRTLAYLACRGAIKAGDILTQEEKRSLITKLAETPNSATCPHGRPTTITFTISDLEKLFHRK